MRKKPKRQSRLDAMMDVIDTCYFLHGPSRDRCECKKKLREMLFRFGKIVREDRSGKFIMEIIYEKI